jgi:cell division septation protein DedD
MAENRKAKDKRYYLSRGQFIALGGGFTIVSVIVFLLGMLVGKSIEERKVVKPPEPLVRIPVRPAAQGSSASAGQSREEMTFYETLTKSASAPVLSEEAPKEVKRNPDKAVKVEPKDPNSGVREGSVAKARKLEEKPASRQTVENSDASKAWTVQVNAFPDEKSAKDAVERLKEKGYKAFSTEVRNNGRVWYRVRVGHFNSREEAEKVENTLRNKENMANAFATSR